MRDRKVKGRRHPALKFLTLEVEISSSWSISRAAEQSSYFNALSLGKIHRHLGCTRNIPYIGFLGPLLQSTRSFAASWGLSAYGTHYYLYLYIIYITDLVMCQRLPLLQRENPEGSTDERERDADLAASFFASAVIEAGLVLRSLSFNKIRWCNLRIDWNENQARESDQIKKKKKEAKEWCAATRLWIW